MMDTISALISHISDSVLVQELSSLFYFEKSRWLYNRGKFKESIPSIEEAIKLDPKNDDLQSMLVSALGIVFQTQSDFTQVERTLLDYRTRFPELKKHHGFNGLQARLYLYQFNIGYVSGKIQEGERYRDLFQKLMEENPDITIESNLIGQAYSRAAVYHYKKGQVSKAKLFINTGLKYAPGSYELIERQYMIH